MRVVQKYGIVPQAVYPESFSSSASATVNTIVTAKLREFGLELRQIVDLLQKQRSDMTKDRAVDQARRRKDEMMKVIFDVLSCTMGTPPKPDAEFVWETYDRDGKVLKIVATPKGFYQKYTGPYRPSECFSLINDPRNKYDQLYTVERLGNVKGGLSIRCELGPHACSWWEGGELIVFPMRRRQCTGRGAREGGHCLYQGRSAGIFRK